MALPIRDGNQSLTTLSTLIVGSAHIPAHTVVSLGSQAITDIAQAVSAISGTVTVSNATTASAVFVKICGELEGAGTNEPRQILTDNSGMLYARLAPSNLRSADPVIYDPVAGTAYINVRQQAGTSITVGNSVTIGSLPPISGTVTVGASSVTFNAYIGQRGDGSWQPISLQSGSNYVNANVQNSVTIGSLPAISGTVTANVGSVLGLNEIYLADADNDTHFSTSYPFPISGTVTVGGFSSVSIGSGALLVGGLRGSSLVPIPLDSGTGNVAVQLKQSSGPSNDPISQTNGLWVRQADNSTITVGNSVTIGSLPAISGTVTVGGFSGNAITTGYTYNGTAISSVPVIVMENALGSIGSVDISSGSISVTNSVTIGSVPKGSLTTHFGTPTAANTAFATSAVTNANRKYLLIQNVTTGSNVITVGIGFTPTTTQGIQLTAGAGITFESSYIPTGTVHVLSSVTASNFTILEA